MHFDIMQHRRVTQLWPSANSQSESFNKPIMTTMKTPLQISKAIHGNPKHSQRLHALSTTI